MQTASGGGFLNNLLVVREGRGEWNIRQQSRLIDGILKTPARSLKAVRAFVMNEPIVGA